MIGAETKIHCLDGDFEKKGLHHVRFSVGRCRANISKEGELRLYLDANFKQDNIPIWFLNFGMSTYENLVRSVDFFLEESPFAADLEAIERNFLYDVLYVSKGHLLTYYLYSTHNPYVGQKVLAKSSELKFYREASYDAIRFHQVEEAADLIEKVEDFYTPHNGHTIRVLLSSHIALTGDTPFKAIPDDLLNAVSVEKFV